MAINSSIVGASLVVAQMVKILDQENLPKKRMAIPTPVFLPGESPQREGSGGGGYDPWVCKQLDTTKQLTLSLVHADQHP